VIVTPAERQRLVKLGKPLGTAIRDLITIVTPRTFVRWVTGEGRLLIRSSTLVACPMLMGCR
jgi:hypothetical protein